jgi:hypothetical protein
MRTTDLLLPFDKHGNAKYSKDQKEYRVRINGKIVAYGHTPEEAVEKAYRKGYHVSGSHLDYLDQFSIDNLIGNKGRKKNRSLFTI